jgi:hypothetical protein
MRTSLAILEASEAAGSGRAPNFRNEINRSQKLKHMETQTNLI